MKAIVDQDECIGCGVCIEMCPEVFKWNDDETAVAYTNPVPEDVRSVCQEAAESCPSEAITIEE
jgi:ferredoxin